MGWEGGAWAAALTSLFGYWAILVGSRHVGPGLGIAGDTVVTNIAAGANFMELLVQSGRQTVIAQIGQGGKGRGTSRGSGLEL